MELAGGDAHLRAEAVTEAVGKACGAVHIHPRAVHAGQELLLRGFVPRENGVGVVGAVAVDVGNGFLHAVHDLDGQDGVQILRVPVRVGGGLAGDDCPRPFVAAKLHALFSQRFRAPGQERGGNVFMHQQRFRGVAHGQRLGLGVHDHLDGHFYVGGGVHVGVAQALGVAHHGDGGVLHDVLDKGVAAPGDDQVDGFILGQHIVHVVAGFQQRGPAGGQQALYALLHGFHQGAVGAQGFAAALEQRRVAAFQAQPRDLHQCVGAGLEHHADHPDGAGDAVQIQPRRQLPAERDFAQRIGQGDQGIDAGTHVGQLRVVKL